MTTITPFLRDPDPQGVGVRVKDVIPPRLRRDPPLNHVRDYTQAEEAVRLRTLYLLLGMPGSGKSTLTVNFLLTLLPRLLEQPQVRFIFVTNTPDQPLINTFAHVGLASVGHFSVQVYSPQHFVSHGLQENFPQGGGQYMAEEGIYAPSSAPRTHRVLVFDDVVSMGVQDHSSDVYDIAQSLARETRHNNSTIILTNQMNYSGGQKRRNYFVGLKRLSNSGIISLPTQRGGSTTLINVKNDATFGLDPSIKTFCKDASTMLNARHQQEDMLAQIKRRALRENLQTYTDPTLGTPMIEISQARLAFKMAPFKDITINSEQHKVFSVTSGQVFDLKPTL